MRTKLAGFLLLITLASTLACRVALPTFVDPTATPKVILTLSSVRRIPTADPTYSANLAQPPGIDNLQPYGDDFSNSASGWPIQDTPIGRATYQDGFYAIEARMAQHMTWSVGGPPLPSGAIDVTASLVSGPSNNNVAYGLGCRVTYRDSLTSTIENASLLSGYVFLVTGAGMFSLYRVQNDSYQALIDWKTAPEIVPGLGTNQLRLVCAGDQLMIFANGVQLGQVQDTSYTIGRLGLFIQNYEQGAAHVNFDNLLIGSPDSPIPGFEQPPGAEQPPEPGSEPPVAGSQIGSITFASALDDNNQPIDPGSTFRSGITYVYGLFEYFNLVPGSQVQFVWYVNGVKFTDYNLDWQGPANGVTWANIYYEDNSLLPEGNWELQIYLNGSLAQAGNFEIVP